MKKVCHLSSVHTTFDTRIFHKECVSLTKEYEVHFVVPAEEDEVVKITYDLTNYSTYLNNMPTTTTITVNYSNFGEIEDIEIPES